MSLLQGPKSLGKVTCQHIFKKYFIGVCLCVGVGSLEEGVGSPGPAATGCYVC